MGDFIQFVINGLSKGAIYSFLALALVVIYRGTSNLNFAQGEMALFSTFTAWWIYDQGATLWFAVVLATLFSFVGGALLESSLMRPAARKSPLAAVVVAIGLFQSLNALCGLLFEGAGDGLPFPNLFPSKATDFWRISDDIIWRYKDMGVLVTVLVLTALLFVLFQKTKIGLAMRMVANNADSAKLVGVPTNRILMLSWGLSASLGAVGGALVAGVNTNVTLFTMFEVFLLSSAAATLGGLDSPIGAVVGGLSLGVIQSLVTNYPDDWWGSSYIGEETAIAVAFIVILIVLLVRPSGLFGSTRVERV